MVESDASRQKKAGSWGRHPSVGRLALASPRAMVAGEMAGARDLFTGTGSQLTHLANVAAAALRTNQETAERLAEDRDEEW